MIGDREFQAVIALPAPERYEHFIKRVADSMELWGLRSSEGWLLLGDDEDKEAFPVWPAERYAAAYAREQECVEEPVPIDAAVWLEEMLPQLEADGVLVAAFPVPSGGAITVTAEEHTGHLVAELEEYE